MSLFYLLKTTLLGLILLQVAPSLVRGIRHQYNALIEPRTSVAIVPLRGNITDSSFYTAKLGSFFKDPEIKAILVKMECTQSSPGSTEIMFREMQSLKQEFSKPVIALIENQCTLSSYLIACAADYIVAPGVALIGPFGADTETCGTGAHAITQELFANYTNMITMARRQVRSKLHDVTSETILTGIQAQQRGLIDEIGGLQTVIRIIKEKALIEGEIEWVYPPAPGGFWGALLGSSNGPDTLPAQLAHALQTHTL